MKISFFNPIQNYANTKSPQKPAQLKMTAPLSSDTVSFGNNELLNQPQKKILEIVNNSVTKTNLIGEGAEAEVYKIPDYDYCFRKTKWDNNKKSKKISFDISEQDKINHIVAKIDSDGSTIMKYFEGTPVAHPFMNEDTVFQNFKTISDLPIKSYNALLKQICHAYKNDMMFDCATANVLLNPKEQSLTAIDFYQIDEPELFKPLSYMYVSLTTSKTPTEIKKEIAAKILLSAVEEFTPQNNPCLTISDFDFSTFSNKLFDNGLIENEKYKNVLIKTFENIKNAKYSEIQKNPDNNKLNGQIKVAKTLIKQLFLD